MTRRLIIFDFDDCLGETEQHIRPAYFRNAQGLGSYAWAERLGFAPSWALNQHIEMGPFLAEAVRENVQPSSLLTTRLEQLAATGATLAILTHGHLSYVTPALAHLGLAHIFPGSHIFDITTNNGGLKTTPDTYRAVLAALGFAPEEATMLEDNPRNLVAAKQAGLATIHVGHGYHHRPDEHGDVIDHHFPTTLQAVESLLSA